MNKFEKYIDWFWRNLFIMFVWIAIWRFMEYLDSLHIQYIDGKLITLFLVSYWLNQSLFKKNKNV